MRYAMARYKKHRRDVAYRIYVTECLRTISENTAKYAGGNYITKRFSDVYYARQENERTGEEIVADLIKNAGLVVIK